MAARREFRLSFVSTSCFRTCKIEQFRSRTHILISLTAHCAFETLLALALALAASFSFVRLFAPFIHVHSFRRPFFLSFDGFFFLCYFGWTSFVFGYDDDKDCNHLCAPGKIHTPTTSVPGNTNIEQYAKTTRR